MVVKFEGRGAVFFIIIILTAIITLPKFVTVRNLTHAPSSEAVLKIVKGVGLLAHHAICQGFVCFYFLGGFWHDVGLVTAQMLPDSALNLIVLLLRPRPLVKVGIFRSYAVR